jgi:predicted DNA-binding transcriptional regulator YafY
MPDEERDPVDKVCRLLTAVLENGGLTYAQAASRMGVKDARARAIVKQCVKQIPWLKVDTSGRRHVVRTHGVSRTEPSLAVAIAACFGGSVAPIFAGTKYEAGMREALRFVVAASPRPERFVDLDRRFLLLAGGGEVEGEDRARVLDLLARAVLEQCTIRFRYHAAEHKPRVEQAEPWALVIHKNRLYLLGRAVDREPWVWRFARIHQPKLLRRKRLIFPSRDAFDPAVMFKDSFGIWLQPKAEPEEVEIALDRRWKQYALSHKWHHSQEKLKVRPGGRISVRLKVKICRELKEWIFGFGGDAEVMRPATLREEVAHELQRAIDRYEARSRSGPAGSVNRNRREPSRRRARKTV